MSELVLVKYFQDSGESIMKTQEEIETRKHLHKWLSEQLSVNPNLNSSLPELSMRFIPMDMEIEGLLKGY